MDDYGLTEQEARVLGLDLVKDIREFSRQAFRFDPKATWSEHQGFVLCRAREIGFPRTITEQAIRVYGSQRKRTVRVRSRIEKIAGATEKAWFLTLTFTDEVLATTSDSTRRIYVARYLKAISPEYVANIDFGSENGREHYHAVVLAATKPGEWPYGFMNSKLIGSTDSDSARLSKYITKLTLHALKVERTGKARRLIYSRKNRILITQSLADTNNTTNKR